MSRCFPFPPPGYEKKPKAENLDLLTKEKRKEKHHKKEKKEKEKRERKDKKEKDRSKDKRKEKKERKERHKDRKKDKGIIDKGRSSEDRRAEDRNEGAHNPENLQKVEEGKDSKFAEELGRRIRDNGADNRMLGSITSSVHRKIEQAGGVAHPSLDKNSKVTDKRMFPLPIGSSQRNDGSSNLPIENATNSPYRRIGTITTAASMDQDRSKSHERLTIGIITDQNRNHGTSRSIEGIPGFVNRKSGMEKEKIPEKNLVPNSIIAPAVDNKGKLSANVFASNKRKNDFLGSPVESLTSVRSKPTPTGNSFVQRRIDGMGALPAIDKGRVKGSGMFPPPFSSDQRRNTAIVQPLQKDKKQKVDRQDEATKGLKDSEHEHTAEKNKPKDAYKHTKEEEEKIAEKAAVTENNYIRNLGKKDPIDTLSSKPLAPHKDNTASSIRGVDETSNKRKNLKINGFIQENDVRPNKMLRMAAPSSQPLAGSPLKPDRVLDHKAKEIKGSVKPQQLPDGNGELSSKAPHPDSKYLEQIYSLPKMVPLLQNDDMDWLFYHCDPSHQKPKRRPASEEGIPQVWAQATRIESADVLALPYVLPF